MIKTTLLSLEVLRGARSMKFRTSRKRTDHRTLHYQGANDKLNQDVDIGEIIAWVEQFSTISCRVSLVVGAKEGKETLDGEVKALTSAADRRAKQIVKSIDSLVGIFAHNFPKSSFKITYEQRTIICEVDGAGPGN